MGAVGSFCCISQPSSFFSFSLFFLPPPSLSSISLYPSYSPCPYVPYVIRRSVLMFTLLLFFHHALFHRMLTIYTIYLY
ncbi:hypothetical protein HOY82DRAFT_34258 [Tuber indicum]|nr:hypothetical protein HOY82DRAFT_34258 [Tuber indicum]